MRLTRADGSVQVLSVCNEDPTVIYRDAGGEVVFSSVRGDATLVYRDAAGD